jgi:hypothetical protein
MVTREGAPWAAAIQAVDTALDRQDVQAARRGWDDAHLAALDTWGWEGLLEVGEAYLRIGSAAGSREAAAVTARRVYFAALFRACQEDSFDGILRAAEAFGQLGDRPVVEECVGLAQLLAPDDERRARARAMLATLGGARANGMMDAGQPVGPPPGSLDV